MYVVKRDGKRQDVQFDKITARIARLCYGLDGSCDPVTVAQKVAGGIYRGVTTAELDELAAETAAAMTSTHPDYATLGARIAVSNLHKNTRKSFLDTLRLLHANALIADDVLAIVEADADRIEAAIRHDRDFEYDYFGFKTLERSYLLRVEGRVVERPQHMLMRVAIGIHRDRGVGDALETYRLMSEKWFTHASPTLFNSGTPRPQMSSCFLLTLKADSIEGIYDTLKECAIISKNAGGIGLAIHDVRAKGSYIRGTNGTSNGLVPMLRVFNDTARYVDQGGGKRKGAFAVYLEPWHADVLEWLDLRKNHGKEEARARDLFLGLWVCDLFMRRVETDDEWSLFCPHEAPGLADVWGHAFDELYAKYELEGRAKRTIRAQQLWYAILDAQIETGTPYMLYKDACNRKSNQQHLGTIRSSNLCTEIVEYTSPDETAVCNLASLALPRFVVQFDGGSTTDGTVAPSAAPLRGTLDADRRSFDFDRLAAVTRHVVRNLNRIIDGNHYPVETARRSNLRHRPIGVGVQGLADVFLLLGMPYGSPQARALNKRIFECIYFSALTESCALAAQDGPHETFFGSPASGGMFQHNLWGVEDSAAHDWPALRDAVRRHGLRNSLLVAPMPTASTSQILGNNECFEPYTSNIYVRRVLSGEFTVVNQHLMTDLVQMGLWSPAMKTRLVAANGSVQGMDELPDSFKALYRTAWEIKQRAIMDMAADRAVFIDQSQSLNVFMEAPDHAKLTSMHFYGWRLGLKTGMYYLRTRPAADAIQFTVDAAPTRAEPHREAAVCPLADKDACLACGS